jgi:hypothetical protein
LAGTGYSAAVELAQKVGFALRNEIHQPLCKRLLIGERLCFADGLFRELGIAAALFGERAHPGAGVTFDFAAHNRIEFLTKDHGRGRASARARGHGRDVAGKQEEETRRSRARTARGDIGDDGNRRGHHPLDHIAAGRHQATGRVQAHNNKIGLLRGGLIESVAQHLDCHGMNHAVKVDAHDGGGKGRLDPEPAQQEQPAHGGVLRLLLCAY